MEILREQGDRSAALEMAGEEAAMETKKRMQRICMITKIEKNPEYSEKLGIKDKSHFRQMEKTRGKEVIRC